MNIVMVVYNNIATDARVQRAATSLGKTNNVIVISSGCNAVQSELFRNITIPLHRVPSMLNYILFVRKAISIIKYMNFDLLYGHDYYSAYILDKVSLIFKDRKYVYDAHELIIPDKQEKLSFRSRLFLHFERKAIKKSNLIICAQEDRTLLMKEFYNLKRTPVTIKNISKLPDGYCTVPATVESFFSKYKRVVVYAGIISKTRQIDKLVKEMADLDSVGLLIIGNGDQYNELKKLIEDEDIKNVLLAGSIPYQQLSSILRRCDIGYLFYPTTGLNNIYCVPNKIFEYASVGLPMLANENPTVRRIFDDSQIGICTNSIKDGVKKLLANHLYYASNVKDFNYKASWKQEEHKLVASIKQLFEG